MVVVLHTATGVELLGRSDVADKLREELDGVHKGVLNYYYYQR